MKPFKIWCETEAERKKVVKKLDKMDCKWGISGAAPSEIDNRPAPISYFVNDCNKLSYGHDRDYFIKHRYEIIPVNEFLKDETIVIFRKGQEVIALDKSTGERGVAKCHPNDKFDFKVGAVVAFNRLVCEEPAAPAEKESGTFYVLCVANWSNVMTKNKIYKFVNGRAKFDITMSFDYKSFDDFIANNKDGMTKVIELKPGVKFQIKPDIAKFSCEYIPRAILDHAGEIVEMSEVSENSNIRINGRLYAPEWLNPIKEVERKAKPGEFVKIVEGINPKDGEYKNGDILKVLDGVAPGGVRYSEDGGCYLFDSEYVVLEGYEDCKHVKVFKPKYYTGKICITKVLCGPLTVGKIYEVKAGKFKANDGNYYPQWGEPVKNVEDLKKYFNDRTSSIVEFVEVVE